MLMVVIFGHLETSMLMGLTFDIVDVDVDGVDILG
jgi:hypothetical protein